MRCRNRAQTRSRSEGFTLVEMVVSVTLIALMALSIWIALSISISSWKRGTESMDENQRHRATLDLVQKQIASVSAIIPPLDLQLGVGQFPVFAGTDTGVQFITQCPLRFRDNPGLTFVSYQVVPGQAGKYALVEQETRYLGGDPIQTVTFDDAIEPPLTIFDNLAGASFEYFDPGDDQTPGQWVTSWDSAEAGRLPAALSIYVSSLDSQGVVQNRQVVVPLMSEADNLQGFVDPFGGRRGGPGMMGPPGGRRGPGEPGGGRGGRIGPGDGGRGRGGPGEPGRGRGGPGFGPGGPRRGQDPGFGIGRRGPGFNDPLPGGRRGGRF